MDLSTRVLGRSVVSYLTDRQTGVILTIGSDKFDRSILAGVACYHFVAAANLSKLLGTVPVANTRALFETVDPLRLALPRLGAISIAVLGAAFEAKGIGGKSPLEAWFAKHRDKSVSFSSLKHHANPDPEKPTKKEAEIWQTIRPKNDSSRRSRTTKTRRPRSARRLPS